MNTMKFNTTVIGFLALSCMAAAQKNWKLWKPTNSVTIRQNGGSLCANHLVGEFVPHAEDCQMFYLCVENGDAVLASCPPTMLFNSDSKLCDTAGNVRCRNDTESGMENAIPPNDGDNDFNKMITDAATYCATLTQQQSNDRIVYIGSSSSCSNYYICYYGQAILQECSSELHWNAMTGKCDVPERAQCTLGAPEEDPSTNPIAPNANINSGVAVWNEFIHCPTYGQHLYPHMQRCEFFIYCVKGHPTLQQCPFYYFFDIASKSCQWSRTALCVRDLNLPPQIKRQT
ncbi:probable chitinase 10 [Drosophila miranda]|uniref:probable chitinase 10 n=1 Tax=Drosophila miranda TaxID=7229 RepID=UPI0007E76979|nr:probable chitinase 10 [Drosophila miranda]